MKKILFILFIIILGIFGYYYFIYRENNLKILLKDVEKEEFYIESYSIFGTHFSISGCIDKTINNDLNLVLKNKSEEIKIDSEFYLDDNRTCFYLSDKNNGGLYLDSLKTGSFLLMIKETDSNNDLYYSLNNKTEYKNLEYYTITKDGINNKININFDNYNEINYVNFIVEETKLPENVYDIVIDPGHGGKDVGSSGILNGETYYEANLTLKICLLLKGELEDLGIKVKLTREDDSYLEPYGEGGRALIPNEFNSKYSLSIHLNSSIGTMNYGGVEIYTPNDINYDLATLLADNIANVVGYSKKATDRISNGIYYTYFTKQNIEDSKQEMLDKNMKPYDIKEGSPYMYMIREVGGINTSAYIDGRNDYYGINDYYNSNQTAEPYLLELAYLNYSSDLNKLVNTPEKFSKAIGNALKEYLDIS